MRPQLHGAFRARLRDAGPCSERVTIAVTRRRALFASGMRLAALRGMRVVRSVFAALLVSVAVTAGCGGQTPMAKPHDASTEHHEAMAAHEDSEAAAHAAQHDPRAQAEHSVCHYAHRSGGVDPFCWTTATNPTAEHAQEADRHRKMAADHRAASQALRDAEAKACARLADEDRDMSPFYHRQDIVRVDTLPAQKPGARPDVAVVFRALPGMTVERMQHLVDCHLARSASLGHQMPEMDYCPLVPRGVAAKVSSSDGNFVVAIHADDPASSDEMSRRAKALAPRASH